MCVGGLEKNKDNRKDFYKGGDKVNCFSLGDSFFFGSFCFADDPPP